MPTEPIDLEPPPYPAESVPLGNTLYPEAAVYGLNIRHVSPSLSMYFERWPGANRGDYMGWRIGNLDRPIASLEIDNVEDEVSRYVLVVPARDLPEGNVDMFGRVVRIGSGQASRSITQKILIKTTRPGGDDRRVLEPWHSELVMRIIYTATGEPIVDGDTIADPTGGFTCLIDKYLNCRQNDEITIWFDGIRVPHIVSPAEAAGAGPIRVEIPESIILNATQLGSVQVFFSCKDVVGNEAGGKYPYSKPIELRSELDQTLLSPPAFMVAVPPDTEGLEVTQVDLDIDSTSSFFVYAFVDRARVAPRPPHQVKLTFEITPANGTPWVKVFPLAPDTNLGRVKIDVDKELINSLTGGMFRMSFQWLTSAGVLKGQSASTLVRVVGSQVLMPPVISAQIESGLIEAIADLSAEIPTYQPHNPNWTETFSMTPVVSAGGLAPYTETQLAGPQGGIRRVTVANLQRFRGQGFLEIGYSTNEGREGAPAIRKSKVLTAQIGVRDPVLAAPTVKGAVDDNIDPAEMKDPELTIYVPYTGTVAGNVVSWSVIGQNQAGSASGTFPITTTNAGSALPTVGIPVPRLVLDNNNENIISVTYSVTDPTARPPRILRSEVRYISVGKAVRLGIPRVIEASPLQDQIDPKNVTKGATIEMDIRQSRDDDQIFAVWQGAFGISTIEVQVPGNSKATIVKAPIPPEVIAKALRAGGNTITVSYYFTRGPFSYTSVSRDLRLLPPTGMRAPTINAYERGSLPVYEITGDAYFKVDRWDSIFVNQYIWGTLRGTNADGTPYENVIFNAHVLTADEAANGISALVPAQELTGLQDNSHLLLTFSVSYAQVPSTDTAVPFTTRDYVIQTLPSTLPAPAFANQKVAALSIDPLIYENTASVTVTYPGMTTAQTINLLWRFPDGTNATIAARNGLATGRVDFPVSRAVLSASVGKPITLQYSSTSGTKVVWSDVQTLTVQTIPEANLPQALLNRVVNGGQQNLDNFTTSTLSLPAWRLSKVGQRLTITAHSDGVLPLKVLDNYPITANEVTNGLVNIPVPNSWLLTLSNNGRLMLDVESAHDGIFNSPTTVQFPLTEYTIINVPTLASDITTFQNSSMNGWKSFAADFRDLSFSPQGLLNYTYSESSQGMIIRKSFNNMKIGSTYRFSMDAMRVDGRFALPILSLHTNQGPLTDYYYLSSMTTITMSGEFIANTQSMDFMLFNSQPTAGGNDYVVSNAKVTRLS